MTIPSQSHRQFLVGVATFIIGMSATFGTRPSAQTKPGSDLPLKVHAQRSIQKLTASKNSNQVIGCLIEPRISSQVAASAPGVITAISVDRGDRVSKGQVLALLDNDVETALLEAATNRSRTRAAINAARATRDMANQKLSRIRKLNALNYGAKLELELAAGELSLAQSRLQLAHDEHKAAGSDQSVAKRQLARRQVVSPIDGIVADRMLNPGERADGRPIVRIVQLNTLRVEVIFPATQFGKIKAGMTGEVVPELDGIQTVAATVQQVDPFIDAASGTFRARLAMSNPDMAVPAGIRCRITFATDEERQDKG